MPSKRPSLIEHAAASVHKGPKCWLCTIPERSEVEEAVRSGHVTRAAALRWLRDACGYQEASVHRLENHFQNGHDRTPVAN